MIPLEIERKPAPGQELTESLCPVCLKRIAARRVSRPDGVYLVKECADHGDFDTLIWNGEPDFNAWRRPKIPVSPPVIAQERHIGCPFDCGLCPEHRQRTCAAVAEITQRCDLECPVCYADSTNSEKPDMPLDRIAAWFKDIRRSAGDANIQLSGGEPAMRDDLPEIVSIARKSGFSFVQLNTNGVRLGSDPALAGALGKAGLSSVFLQFDGTHDGVYKTLRGRPLLKEKLAAIDACGKGNIGVVLVPTIVPGVNDHNAGDILRLAAAHSPTVRGVHFQPVSLFGRYPGNMAGPRRITLPDLMRAIEIQTGGDFKASHFKPPGCENARCSFHGNYILDHTGKAVPVSNSSCCGKPEMADEGARRAVSFVGRQWKAHADCPEAADAQPSGSKTSGLMTLDEFIARARRHMFSVSAMAFMDAWTIDLDRVRDCCIHMAVPDGRLIPFCLYNLTSENGTSLYRS